VSYNPDDDLRSEPANTHPRLKMHSTIPDVRCMTEPDCFYSVAHQAFSATFSLESGTTPPPSHDSTKVFSPILALDHGALPPEALGFQDPESFDAFLATPRNPDLVEQVPRREPYFPESLSGASALGLQVQTRTFVD
jgi:hypothetical protein